MRHEQNAKSCKVFLEKAGFEFRVESFECRRGLKGEGQRILDGEAGENTSLSDTSDIIGYMTKRGGQH